MKTTIDTNKAWEIVRADAEAQQCVVTQIDTWTTEIRYPNFDKDGAIEGHVVVTRSLDEALTFADPSVSISRDYRIELVEADATTTTVKPYAMARSRYKVVKEAKAWAKDIGTGSGTLTIYRGDEVYARLSRDTRSDTWK